MEQIRDMIKKHESYLFSDEVHSEFIYSGSPYISACRSEGIEQSVALIDSSLSVIVGVHSYLSIELIRMNEYARL